ncbi:MAG: hypothetical protein IIC56_05110 [Proteobacteria bacterium]|nr:hypothetical protein [Pseudomonadota bacterium]
MFPFILSYRSRFPLLILSVLAAGALTIGGAAAQKPDFAGKPGFAGQGAGKADKGERGRSEEALEHAKKQGKGKGKKKGIAKRDDKGKKK